MWEFPKLGDPDIGVLIIRILLSVGYYIRVPYFWKLSCKARKLGSLTRTPDGGHDSSLEPHAHLNKDSLSPILTVADYCGLGFRGLGFRAYTKNPNKKQ